MQSEMAVNATLILAPKGPADLLPGAKVLDRVLQLDGEAVARELPARHQLIAHGWGHLSYMPYLVYMREKQRLLLLFNSRASVHLDSDPHPVLLCSDDAGRSWRPMPIRIVSGTPFALRWALGLSYFGNGVLAMDVAESDGPRLFSHDYGETWEVRPLPKAASGFPWYHWDPCYGEVDPATGTLTRLLDTGYSTGMEKRFDRARKILILPEEWHWRHDPADRGLAEEWQRDQVFTHWPRRMRIDRHWTMQGEPGGVGWYATRFALPDTGSAPLAIAFGAVDGTCDVFVDGQQVGEQKLPPEVMWDQPFHLPLAGGLQAGAHTLVIRVEKVCGPESNAGIHLPVWIVEDPGPDPAADRQFWRRNHAFLRFSFDGGRTWPEEIEPPSWNGASGVGVNEVALCRAADGDLVAGCRITHPAYYGEPDPARIDHYCGLGVSRSSDHGRTWTPIQVLYEHGRMHPSMAVLPDGTLVLTYVVRTGALKPEHRLQDADGFSQWSVEALVSHDHGVSWDLARRYVLGSWSGAGQSQSTSTVVLPDGWLLTAFGSGYLSRPVPDAMAPPSEVCLVRWRPEAAVAGCRCTS
jgi:hypothetical protein